MCVLLRARFCPLLSLVLMVGSGLGFAAPRAAAQAPNVRQVSLTTNDIIYDSHTGKIYATVPSSVGSGGNSITPIDPVTGTVGAPVFVGSEPDKLALSDDGSALYVALDGAASIRRFDTATQTPGLVFSYGAGSVKDMQVAPGEPATLAVALGVDSTHDGNAGVAVFQNGVAEPDPPYQGSIYELDSLAFGSSTRLYGFDNYSSGYEFARLTLGNSALFIQDHLGNLITGYTPGYGVTIKYDSGLVYASSGAVIDPETLSLVGRFSGASSSPGSSVSVRPDAANGRVFFLSSANLSSGQSGTATIQAYDSTTFLPTGSLTIPGVVGLVSSFITYGANGLAFRTSGGQVFLIDSRDLPGLASLTLSPATLAPGSTAIGTVTLTQPAPAGGVTVALSASSAQAAGVPPSVTVPAGAQSAAFPLSAGTVTSTTDVTITAIYGAQSIQATLTVQDAAGDAEYPAGIRVVNLPANDLVYDPVTTRIYASVPSSAIVPGSSPGNSIVAIDPLTGAMDVPIFIGSEPSKLALSNNGQSLFVGLNGAAAVRRLDLPTKLADPFFHLGSDSFLGPYYPQDIQTVPGSTNSVAVAEQIFESNPSNTGVAIFDNGIARSNVVQRQQYFYDSLAFSSDPSKLYAFGNEDTSFGFSRLSVDSSGVSSLGGVGNLFGGFGVTIKYDSGLVYASSGPVVNPEASALVGTFSGVGANASVKPDVADNRVFFVSSPNAGIDETTLIQAFDPNTFLPVGSLTIPNVVATAYVGPSSLLRWGADGLAFRTSGGQIFLIRTSLIPNTQPAPASVTVTPAQIVGGGAVTGTVTLSAPAPSGGVTVWLSSSNPDLASLPASLAVAAGQVSAAFTVTTRPVASMTPVTLSAVSGGTAVSTILKLQAPSYSRTHVLWHNTTTGQTALWTLAADGSIIPHGYGPYPGWTSQFVADGPDGLARILWTNTDGRMALWSVGADGTPAAAAYGPFAGWTPVALAVGLDSHTHVLWNHSPDNQMALWDVNAGGQPASIAYGPYPGYTASKLAVSPDNHVHVLWTVQGGGLALWDIPPGVDPIVNGYGVPAAYTALALSAGPDNHVHVLWNHAPDNQLALWDVDTSGTPIGVPYGPYSGYTARSLAVSPDNHVHVLWDVGSGGNTLWDLAPGLTPTAALYTPGAGWAAVAISAQP